MDKGIRPACREKFVELNELRRRGIEPYNTAKANTVFRRHVMEFLQVEFGCTLAASATHYNDALVTVREACPELVSGLGRPEDKKGGRRPRQPVQQPVQQTVQQEFQEADGATQAEYRVLRKSDSVELIRVETLEEARDIVRRGRWFKRRWKMYWI